MKIINQANDKIVEIVKPIWDQIVQFFSKEYYVVYAVIVLFLVILIIPGLFALLKRCPKFFALITILLGIIVLLWYFFVHKN